MQHTCGSCGREAGSGSYCQHCGSQLSDGPEAIPTPSPTPDPQPRPQSVAPTTDDEPTAQPAPPARPQRSGWLTGCLIASVVVAALLVVGGYFGWRFFNDEILPEIQEVTGEAIPFSETPPGPCIDLEAESGLLADWTEASCDGPRNAEITYSAAFNDGPYPGDQYLADQATITCRDAFEGYVGIPPDQSRYGFSWIVPTEETWANGSRHGICLVIPGDGGVLTGVIKGAEE